MSRNIELIATRGSKFNYKAGPVWQTPTEVTLVIEKSTHPFALYCDWVMESKINLRDKLDHIEDVRTWITDKAKMGYSIEWLGG